MDSITRLSANSDTARKRNGTCARTPRKPPVGTGCPNGFTPADEAAGRFFRLPAFHTGTGSLKRLFQAACVSAVLCTALSAAADGIFVEHSDAELLSDGRLSVSSRFQTALPPSLADALKTGVPLDFVLSYRLHKPAVAAYRFRLGQLVRSTDSITYRLSYHAVTGRYRVNIGSFATEYAGLDGALKAVGAIAHWRIFDKGELAGLHPEQISAQIRLKLSTARLPKPFQINIVSSQNWQLDSGWHKLPITKVQAQNP